MLYLLQIVFYESTLYKFQGSQNSERINKTENYKYSEKENCIILLILQK